MRIIGVVAAIVTFLISTVPALAQSPSSAANVRLAFTGDARRADGHLLHYAVTFFRYVPAEAALTADQRRRATVFVATCTLTDDTAQRHVVAQRFGRARFDELRIDGYHANIDAGGWTYTATTANGVAAVHLHIDDARMRLELDALGPVNPEAPFVPPMRTTGRIDDAAIRGHSTVAVDTEPELLAGAGEGRIIATVHITGARGIHTVRITRTSNDATIRVAIIEPDGRVLQLKPDDVHVTARPNSTWISSATSLTYQTVWLVTIRPLAAAFSISPAQTNQEFIAVPRGDSFWEGAVLVGPLDPDHQVFGRGVVMVSPMR